ncbi:GNAT family N-acetyltransferase [Flavobacterium sp. NRK F10]|uniref:GNAT family N-acetyltransferase n=1 Tax=Flavobacterium sediminis TaxID=2201181 RepID=A0A2U8QWG0_9FLAO|nr:MULTISPECIES: GNAT family N-acetyltransferase [Flavobacterium]AWM14498.1 GNAT family N-acetyltransferase [Flavobacterium sediminis]MCO6175729.1 GNAT family N-acetyltransferase [Flavobacterium sp. NRK F10]
MIEIKSFQPEYREAFKQLNLHWIEKYFKVEDPDIKALTHPEEYILEKGGEIFTALYKKEPVGVVAIIKVDDTTYELAKMAVAENHQGKSISNYLIQACIAYAKDHKARKIILYTNSSLKPAIHLYKKFGFTEHPIENNQYDRADIYMTLDL